MKTITFDETKWKLVPVQPTLRMLDVGWGICGGDGHPSAQPNRQKINVATANYSALISATPAASSQPVTLTDRQFDLICQAIDKADTITMEGDYMLDSDDCIGVVRVMQALFSIAALREKQVAKLDYESMYCWLTDGKRGDWIWNHVLTDEEKNLGNDIDSVVVAALREKGQTE